MAPAHHEKGKFAYGTSDLASVIIWRSMARRSSSGTCQKLVSQVGDDPEGRVGVNVVRQLTGEAPQIVRPQVGSQFTFGNSAGVFAYQAPSRLLARW
jgi:hypothetical protein